MAQLGFHTPAWDDDGDDVELQVGHAAGTDNDGPHDALEQLALAAEAVRDLAIAAFALAATWKLIHLGGMA